MTGEELKTLTESLIDDTIEETLFYTLLNSAKDSLEDDRPWRYLMDVDSSQSRSASDTYLTMKTLPASFKRELKVNVGSEYGEYQPIPMEKREDYKDSAKCYYVDIANGEFAITGAGDSGTIKIIFLKNTDAITANTSPSFPARFHPILAYKVAAYITGGIDADPTYNKMSPVHRMAFLELYRNMKKWDNMLLNKAYSHTSGYANDGMDFNDILSRM